jgi:hypothetical protein
VTDPTATDRAALRETIAALFRNPPGAERLGDATPGEIADAVLAVLPASADRAAVLSKAERTMLTYALDQAQEHIWSRDGFTDEDQAAVDSLRRMADEAQPADAWDVPDARPGTTDYTLGQRRSDGAQQGGPQS